jgi:hypothetical protein
MIRWGLTRQNKQRFRCKFCEISSIKKRPDQTKRRIEVLFERWLLETETLKRLAKHRNTKPPALIRLFEQFWDEEILPLPYQGNGLCVIVDGLFVGRGHCILIAIDGDGIPITWYGCTKENTTTWEELFRRVKSQGVTNPLLIVSDGQKGLLKAMDVIFTSIPQQRCMTHVVRLAQAWLTRFPKTIAGRELRTIVGALYSVTIQEGAENWNKIFNHWCIIHHDFLKEKSIPLGNGRPWFTHRKLRAVRSLVQHAQPELFTFLSIPNTPKTTNDVEGGLNSPMKALLRHHRGMPPQYREVFVFRFLRRRQIQKYQH